MAFTGKIYISCYSNDTVPRSEVSRRCTPWMRPRSSAEFGSMCELSAVAVCSDNFPFCFIHWDYYISSSIHFFIFFLCCFLPSYLHSFLCIVLFLFQTLFTHHVLVRAVDGMWFDFFLLPQKLHRCYACYGYQPSRTKRKQEETSNRSY